MSKLISVVMAYHNRLPQLLFTLKVFELFSNPKLFEIVIVDDASNDKEKAELAAKKVKLDIKIITINAKDRWWINPCVPYNMGFKAATGEKVVIQNPEVFHVGNIVDYVNTNLICNKYFIFSVKSIKSDMTSMYHRWLNNDKEILSQFSNLTKSSKTGKGMWYQHPKYRPVGYHFLSAICRKDLDNLGGFDERYAKGYCADDVEFFVRIKRSPISIEMVDSDKVWGIHQWHPKFNITNTMPEWKANHRILHEYTEKEKGWKANI